MIYDVILVYDAKLVWRVLFEICPQGHIRQWSQGGKTFVYMRAGFGVRQVWQTFRQAGPRGQKGVVTHLDANFLRACPMPAQPAFSCNFGV